jgi:predicted kinase
MIIEKTVGMRAVSQPGTDTAVVAKLILLNGPPASGKSTLAALYVDRHPLALNLDVDRLRSLIGGWRADPETAGLLARALAVAAARTHLTAGHDVVIPQYLGRAAFIEQLERLAGELGAEFHEVVLLDEKASAIARFVERSRAGLDPAHVNAAQQLDRAGGLDELSAMYDRLLLVVASRPGVRIVATIDGQVEETYGQFEAALTQMGGRQHRGAGS